MAVVTKVYENYVSADQARAHLQAAGIADVEVAMLGDERLRDAYGAGPVLDATSGISTGAGIGAVAGGGAGLLAGLGMIAIPGIGPLVAAGWLAATAVGAVSGAVVGSAVGALADIGLDEADAPVFTEAMRRGNVAVTVRFPEEARGQVMAALDRVPSVALEDLRTRHEAEGWRHADADAYADADANAQRQERLRNADYRNPMP